MAEGRNDAERDRPQEGDRMSDASSAATIARRADGSLGAGLGARHDHGHRHHARAAADRHSRRVRVFKIVLPLLGLLALVAVGGLTFAKVYFRSAVDVRNVLFSKDGLTMVEPRLSGRSQGRTYDVSAARAFQSIADPKVVRMEGIDGRLVLADGTTLKIDSGTGVYDGNRETLRLEGGVTLAGSNGWRAEGPNADVDLVGGRISGTGGIRITGPDATIAADALDLTDNGHHAVFQGNVRMTLTPRAPADPAAPTADTPAAPPSDAPR